MCCFQLSAVWVLGFYVQTRTKAPEQQCLLWCSTKEGKDSTIIRVWHPFDHCALTNVRTPTGLSPVGHRCLGNESWRVSIIGGIRRHIR